MHEVSIATQLLELVAETAARHAVRVVRAVQVDVGVMDAVSPEALRTAFALAAEGTLAAGARLDLTEVAIQAQCKGCATRFAPALDNYACPGCGQADVQILEGRGIVLRSLECETGDDSEVDHRCDPRCPGQQ
jgi:hydrogenase nickel incorporation protein HypA/HybF